MRNVEGIDWNQPPVVSRQVVKSRSTTLYPSRCGYIIFCYIFIITNLVGNHEWLSSSRELFFSKFRHRHFKFKKSEEKMLSVYNLVIYNREKSYSKTNCIQGYTNKTKILPIMKNNSYQLWLWSRVIWNNSCWWFSQKYEIIPTNYGYDQGLFERKMLSISSSHR